MDFVDEQHLARGEVRDDADQVARLFDGGSRRRAHGDAHLVANHVRERRFSQTRRAVQEDVIERLAALLRGGNRHLQVLADPVLSDVLVEPARPQARFVLRVFVHARRGHETIVHLLRELSQRLFQHALEAGVGARSAHGDRSIGGFFGERPMIPQVHECRDHIVP